MFTSQEQKEAIYLLWDRVADCDRADADASMTVLLEGACALLSAGNCRIAITVRLPFTDPRDPLQGWRFRELIHLWDQKSLAAVCIEHVAETEQGVATEVAIGLFREAGRFRADLLQDLATPDYFDTPDFARHFGGIGVSDALFVTTPLGDGAEVGVTFYRMHGEPPFTPTEGELAADILRPMKWLLRRFALSYGLLAAGAPITPAERRVLQQLLTGRSEKDIAADLGVSYQTVHKHVKQIYKKLGVSSRAGVAALWLGNGEDGSDRYRALLPARS